jgi:hypothetical protein
MSRLEADADRRRLSLSGERLGVQVLDRRVTAAALVGKHDPNAVPDA